MPFDSNGVFSRVMKWTSDQQNGIAIECGRHDAEDDNFAQGFNETFCRDGRAAATGNFNLGQHKIQNLAAGTATTDAVNKGQLDSGLSAKANTADVVNLTGTQTIAGTKTFQGTGWTLYIKNTSVTYNKAPSSDTTTAIAFVDKNSQNMGVVECFRLTDNSTTMQFNVYGRKGSWATRPLEFKILSNGKEVAFAPASDINDSIVTTVSKSKGTNGYFKLGNGLIVQWGYSSASGEGLSITFPTPFSSTNYGMGLTVNSGYGGSIWISEMSVTDRSKTGFKYGNSSKAHPFSWVAIGY